MTTSTKTTKKKIVLFAANTRYVGPPLGLLSITKLLDLKKYDVKIITQNEYPDCENALVKECKGAICLGISVMSGFPLKAAKRVSQRVKAKYPKLPIVWGGWLTTTLPEESLKPSYVDYVCMGQGERLFSQLIDVIDSRNFKDLNKIPRLGYKKGSKIFLSKRIGTDDIDSLPDFDMDLIKWENYLEITDFGKRVIRMTTSYGCPHRCSFCCEPLNSTRIWKALSAERVINYIKKLKEKVDFDGLTIVDSNFFVSEERTIKIFKGILDSKLNIKIGQVNGRTNILVRYAPSTWRLLKKAGLYNILVGAESGNEEIMTFINKDATVEDTVKLAKICTKYSVQMLASMIVGLPTERYLNDKEKAFQEDLNGVIDLYHKISPVGLQHQLIVFAFGPLPFSPLYNRSIEMGFKPPVDIDGWANYALRNVRVPWIPKKGFSKVEVLNYTTMAIAMDRSNLFSSFPPSINMLIKPTLAIFKKIGEWRFRTKFLSFPLDLWLFYSGMYVFNEINKIFKIVRSTR
ncbi:MAG: radical SAM protein [Candidatus Roizmanbacteria bacterium]|nr:MAG: radical SAM protein [Candidatus Roizmanbacteria bacterium]